MDQLHIETVLFQYVVDRNPVHSGGLHGHRLDATFLEPSRLPVQVLRKTAKVTHGLRIAVRPYRGPTKCPPRPMSIPALSRCTTSKPGLADQIRRPISFLASALSRADQKFPTRAE